MARAMTSCWISDVPSKIVWIKLSGFGWSASSWLMRLTRYDGESAPGS